MKQYLDSIGRLAYKNPNRVAETGSKDLHAVFSQDIGPILSSFLGLILRHSCWFVSES